VSLAVDNDLFSKGEFARRRNVTPGRLSQWLSEGKIFGEAIVGEGRNARIRESVALRQLKAKLEPMQMTGNGLSTKLDAPAAATTAAVLPLAPQAAPPGAPSSPPPPIAGGDSVEEKIKAARLELLERQNREKAREEAVRSGSLTDIEIATKVAGREASRLISMFEGALSSFANAIAAEFKLPQRDVLHQLRGEFRKFRADASAETRSQAVDMPATVEVELSEDESDGETEAD
jgi:hypothetical protein